MAITFRNSSTNLNVGTVAVVNKPASCTNGDIIIIGITCVGDATLVTPTGFNVLGATATDATINGNRLNTYWKIAAAEGAAWSSSLSVSEYWSTFAISFSGSDPTTPIDVQSITKGSGSSIVATSITTTQANDMLVAIGSRYGISAGAWTYPAGYTGDGQTTGWYATIAGAHIVQAAAGASGTATFTASGAAAISNNCAAHIAIKETAAAAGVTTFTLCMLGVGS